MPATKTKTTTTIQFRTSRCCTNKNRFIQKNLKNHHSLLLLLLLVRLRVLLSSLSSFCCSSILSLLLLFLFGQSSFPIKTTTITTTHAWTISTLGIRNHRPTSSRTTSFVHESNDEQKWRRRRCTSCYCTFHHQIYQSTTSLSSTRTDSSSSSSSSTTFLSKEEIQRYSRHLVLGDVGLNGQIRMKHSKVLVIGAGGLGSPCLLYLAAAGIGTIGIVDNDIVDLSNLQRQIIHDMTSLTQQNIDENNKNEQTQQELSGPLTKCESAKRRIVAMNPNINVLLYEMEFIASTAQSIMTNQTWDVVIDGSDNFPTKYLINAILAFEGQVSVFNYNPVIMNDNNNSNNDDKQQQQSRTTPTTIMGPDYRDLLPVPPLPGDVPSCAEGGVLGVLPGTMGCLQATEAIKVILYGTHQRSSDDGIEKKSSKKSTLLSPLINPKVEILSGRILVFDALRMKFTEVGVARDPNRVPITELIDYQGFCAGPKTVSPPPQTTTISSTESSSSSTLVLTSTDTTPQLLQNNGVNNMDVVPKKGQRTIDEDNDNTNIPNIGGGASSSNTGISYHSIEPKDCLDRLLHKQWAPYVIDVRLQTEHDIVALPFTDTVVPYRVVDSIRDLPSNKDVDILVYCKGGVRGKKACQTFMEQGVDPQRLYNLNGGIMKWQQDIDPSMPRY